MYSPRFPRWLETDETMLYKRRQNSGTKQILLISLPNYSMEKTNGKQFILENDPLHS
jgi:hypothetical protein